MAYVDHAFSISDEDIMMDTDSIYTLHNKPPIKEIALAVSLLVFGITGIISGIFMALNRVGGDTGHDEDIMMDTDSIYTLHNKPPIKEIALAVSLLVFGITGIISGIFMALNRVGGDTGHGVYWDFIHSMITVPLRIASEVKNEFSSLKTNTASDQLENNTSLNGLYWRYFVKGQFTCSCFAGSPVCFITTAVWKTGREAVVGGLKRVCERVGRRSLFFSATMVLTTWVITDPLVHSCLVGKGLLHEMKNRIMVEGDSS
ncbi:hypothetical protein Tco_0786801 [Tanacetum coccineum]